MKIAKIEKRYDSFRRGWWRIYPDNGKWIEFREDLWTKEEAIDAFENNYEYWYSR